MTKFFLFILLACSGSAYASDSLTVEKKPANHFGFGAGLDYGAFGARVSFSPIDHIKLFGGVGFAFVGLGLNGGIFLRALPGSAVCPYAGAMYGYNAFIRIQGAEQFDQMYYGPSFKFGLEIWTKKRKNFFDAGLIIPRRASQYYTDLSNIKNNPAIQMYGEPGSVLLSFGFHFGL